jgi:hypothetical protein
VIAPQRLAVDEQSRDPVAAEVPHGHRLESLALALGVKVDRLTRSVAFLSRLLEAGVDVRFADLPAIEGATGRFLLQQMAAVAELEAGMISDRTIKELRAAGCESLRAIAAGLEQRGIPTARGGKWSESAYPSKLTSAISPRHVRFVQIVFSWRPRIGALSDRLPQLV